MGEFRINAVRTGTDEVIDYIDLREPVDAPKIMRSRDALKARVAVSLGCAAGGLVEIRTDINSRLEPVDLPAYDHEHPVFGTGEPHLRLVVSE